jgi:hypothetical protein
MSAVQVAGCSAAGKSAIAAVLARRGLVSIDADDDPLLARFVDPAGAVVAEVPAAPDLAWLARHGWAWNPARLDELIQAAAPATLYVCGGSDNQQELAYRFSQVFLLEIDEPTMLARLDERRDYHNWGHIGDTRDYLRRKLPALQDRLRASGAIPIDARQPLEQVADAIFSRTLPVPPLTHAEHFNIARIGGYSLAIEQQYLQRAQVCWLLHQHYVAGVDQHPPEKIQPLLAAADNLHTVRRQAALPRDPLPQRQIALGSRILQCRCAVIGKDPVNRGIHVGQREQFRCWQSACE